VFICGSCSSSLSNDLFIITSAYFYTYIVIQYILFKCVMYVNSTVKIQDLCVRQLYERLRNAHPNMTVYKKEDIPERYHLKKHYRVPPLLLEADFGYVIVRVSIYCVQKRIRIRIRM